MTSGVPPCTDPYLAQYFCTCNQLHCSTRVDLGIDNLRGALEMRIEVRGREGDDSKEIVRGNASNDTFEHREKDRENNKQRGHD